MKKNKQGYTPEIISSLVRQFQPIRILLTAYELGIFTAIGKTPKFSLQVAKKIKTDPRATDRLLNALCFLGFVIKNGNKFLNTSESARYLVKGKPEYMYGLMHQVHLWNSWTTLTESVRKGTSVISRPESVNDRDIKWLESFIAAMHYRAKENAPEIISRINMKGVKNVLDVGGGSGVFAMAFVNAGKDVKATVFDLPNVIPVTKKYIRKEGLSGKIKTVPGDYLVDPFPKGFDIVFLSAIIHSNSNKENQKLINKCAVSLNFGGRIIIKDQVMNEARTKPGRGTIFAVNMLVGTRGGDTYTENEIKTWFDKAHLKFERRIDMESEDSMLIASKK